VEIASLIHGVNRMNSVTEAVIAISTSSTGVCARHVTREKKFAVHIHASQCKLAAKRSFGDLGSPTGAWEPDGTSGSLHGSGTKVAAAQHGTDERRKSLAGCELRRRLALGCVEKNARR